VTITLSDGSILKIGAASYYYFDSLHHDVASSATRASVQRLLVRFDPALEPVSVPQERLVSEREDSLVPTGRRVDEALKHHFVLCEDFEDARGTRRPTATS
jgi:hypothetical protein